MITDILSAITSVIKTIKEGKSLIQKDEKCAKAFYGIYI